MQEEVLPSHYHLYQYYSIYTCTNTILYTHLYQYQTIYTYTNTEAVCNAPTYDAIYVVPLPYSALCQSRIHWGVQWRSSPHPRAARILVSLRTVPSRNPQIPSALQKPIQHGSGRLARPHRPGPTNPPKKARPHPPTGPSAIHVSTKA